MRNHPCALVHPYTGGSLKRLAKASPLPMARNPGHKSGGKHCEKLDGPKNSTPTIRFYSKFILPLRHKFLPTDSSETNRHIKLWRNNI